MPTPAQITKLATALHNEKLVNLEASTKSFVDVAAHIPDGGAAAADWYVVAGDHYVIVCGLNDRLGEEVIQRG